MHQKVRCVPINLQTRVTSEVDRLQQETHIENLSSSSDKNLISPIVIVVKKINQKRYH